MTTRLDAILNSETFVKCMRMIASKGLDAKRMSKLELLEEMDTVFTDLSKQEKNNSDLDYMTNIVKFGKRRQEDKKDEPASKKAVIVIDDDDNDNKAEPKKAVIVIDDDDDDDDDAVTNKEEEKYKEIEKPAISVIDLDPNVNYDPVKLVDACKSSITNLSESVGGVLDQLHRAHWEAKSKRVFDYIFYKNCIDEAHVVVDGLRHSGLSHCKSKRQFNTALQTIYNMLNGATGFIMSGFGKKVKLNLDTVNDDELGHTSANHGIVIHKHASGKARSYGGTPDNDFISVACTLTHEFVHALVFRYGLTEEKEDGHGPIFIYMLRILNHYLGLPQDDLNDFEVSPPAFVSYCRVCRFFTPHDVINVDFSQESFKNEPCPTCKNKSVSYHTRTGESEYSPLNDESYTRKIKMVNGSTFHFFYRLK